MTDKNKPAPETTQAANSTETGKEPVAQPAAPAPAGPAVPAVPTAMLIPEEPNEPKTRG